MRILLIALVFFFAFCHNQPDENQLIVAVDTFPLRGAPNVSSPEIITVNKGDKLRDLGVVSPFETEMAFGGKSQRMPWLKVETSGKKQGWIFAGAVQSAADPVIWLLQKRLSCYFGEEYRKQWNDWILSCSKIQDEQQFAVAYRTGIALRDRAISELNRRVEPTSATNYQWMANIFPGFVFQRGAENAPPQLYADYHYWLDKAAQTPGNADDGFMQVCLAAFPADSIESPFPVWKFPLSETTSASQLGSGAHLKMFRLIDQTLAQNALFKPELGHVTDALLQDIHDVNTRYWQSKILIVKEMDDIIAQAPKCLEPNDIISLRSRRNMLDNAEDNRIRVDLRSGMYEETE